jgi:hypothetical protein
VRGLSPSPLNSNNSKDPFYTKRVIPKEPQNKRKENSFFVTDLETNISEKSNIYIPVQKPVVFPPSKQSVPKKNLKNSPIQPEVSSSCDLSERVLLNEPQMFFNPSRQIPQPPSFNGASNNSKPRPSPHHIRNRSNTTLSRVDEGKNEKRLAEARVTIQPKICNVGKMQNSLMSLKKLGGFEENSNLSNLHQTLPLIPSSFPFIDHSNENLNMKGRSDSKVMNNFHIAKLERKLKLPENYCYPRSQIEEKLYLQEERLWICMKYFGEASVINEKYFEIIVIPNKYDLLCETVILPTNINIHKNLALERPIQKKLERDFSLMNVFAAFQSSVVDSFQYYVREKKKFSHIIDRACFVTPIVFNRFVHLAADIYEKRKSKLMEERRSLVIRISYISKRQQALVGRSAYIKGFLIFFF